jgi:phosphotransferase system  glucose/maltose/N-acetylglucosamine-specific IIC component
VEKIHPLIGLFSLAIAFYFFPFLFSQFNKKKKKKKKEEEEEGINFHSFLCNKGMDKNSRTTKPND